MEQTLTQLGVGGCFVLLVLREVFGFLKRPREEKQSRQLDLIAKQTEALFTMHDKTDADGVPVWYVRRSLEDAVNRLAKNIDTQTAVLRSIFQEVHDTGRRVGEMVTKP